MLFRSVVRQAVPGRKSNDFDIRGNKAEFGDKAAQSDFVAGNVGKEPGAATVRPGPGAGPFAAALLSSVPGRRPAHGRRAG